MIVVYFFVGFDIIKYVKYRSNLLINSWIRSIYRLKLGIIILFVMIILVVISKNGVV